MKTFHKIAATAAAVAMLSAVPASARDMSQAEKLRRLDIMLMVTSLRCRTGADDFQADFQSFEADHLAELNKADHDLKSEIAARDGAAKADAELDELSVSMANAYGNGHPWLGCHDLKGVAHDLAGEQGPEPLIAAADELLVGDQHVELAVAQH